MFVELKTTYLAIIIYIYKYIFIKWTVQKIISTLKFMFWLFHTLMLQMNFRLHVFYRFRMVNFRLLIF